MIRVMRDEYERFFEKVKVTRDQCWIWEGSTSRGGYGHFRRKLMGKWRMYKAHRYSYEYYKGPIPPGMYVCHTCDNPPCVNPEHLFAGTAKDNANDMFAKQRKSRIIRNPRFNNLNLLFAQKVREYHKENPTMLQITIAKVFGISRAQTSRILKNQIWREEN